jgi:hypothetical protein
MFYPGLSADYIRMLFSLMMLGFIFGQMLDGFIVMFVGPYYGIIVYITISAFFIAYAANLLNFYLTIGFIITSNFFIDIIKSQTIAIITFLFHI